MHECIKNMYWLHILSLPGTVLGVGVTAVKSVGKAPTSWSLQSSGGMGRSRTINQLQSGSVLGRKSRIFSYKQGETLMDADGLNSSLLFKLRCSLQTVDCPSLNEPFKELSPPLRSRFRRPSRGPPSHTLCRVVTVLISITVYLFCLFLNSIQMASYSE